ncbi:MAG: hypothetical protein NZ960_07650 [Candidatus Kapabacteria bacterium]|nr:hypothetical protein [Candidatus Kapabacteria bacterium]MDW8011982.1 hypothetical protein [Bacteroidota bacterium]
MLERVERDSLGRVLLFFSEAPEGWYSDLSADKRRILLSFPHCTLAPTVRSRSWVEGTVREAYLKQDSTDLRIFLSLAAPQGYSAVWLPLSYCLLVTPIRWDTLPPSEDLYHSALLALELRADTVADSLLTEAALRGSSNAAALLAIRALSRGHASTALHWLRQAFGRSSLPDYYAVIAYTAEFTGDARLWAWAQTRFQALTQRKLPPPPPLSPDSLAVLIDAALSWPLADTLPLAPSPPAATVAAAVDSSAVSPSSPLQQRAPEWLLTAAPALFGLFGAAILLLILRHLSQAARRRAADSPKNETQSSAPPFRTTSA